MYDEWTTEEIIKKEEQRMPQSNENKNTTYLNLWEKMKEAFIATIAYSEILECSQINH